MTKLKNPTHREVSFYVWWPLFDAAMKDAGLPAPGMQDARAHYEMGQSPLTALAEALAGNL
jgi:hypothetical protein